jgi:hypothetical protein
VASGLDVGLAAGHVARDNHEAGRRGVDAATLQN